MGVCEVYGGVGEDKGGASRAGRDFCYLGYVVMGGRDRRAMGEWGKTMQIRNGCSGEMSWVSV